jgi:hypothetical protein
MVTKDAIREEAVAIVVAATTEKDTVTGGSV